jgi:hypothetical protein
MGPVIVATGLGGEVSADATAAQNAPITAVSLMIAVMRVLALLLVQDRDVRKDDIQKGLSPGHTARP